MSEPSGDNRNTPRSVLEPVWAMGPVDLDPCHNEFSIVRAKHTYDGITQDGLAQPWFGTVFVNGTWSNLAPWAHKAVASWDCEIFFWCPVYPETAWAKALWTVKPLVCLWNKRVNHPLGGKKGVGTKWPTMMVYIGERNDLFIKTFRPHGAIALML